jgi:hypothetical protein
MNINKYIFIIFIIFIIFNIINKKKYIIDNFYNFDKNYYENIDYHYEPYKDSEYTTPLECPRHFNFIVDPNLPQTIGCYIKLDDMKKYYNPYLKNCPRIWNYNIEIDGVQYCRKDGANLPILN